MRVPYDNGRVREERRKEKRRVAHALLDATEKYSKAQRQTVTVAYIYVVQQDTQSFIND